MLNTFSKLFEFSLIVVHAGLVVWAVFGIAERLLPINGLPPLQNPDFTVPIQWVHWAAILAGGSIFLWGYFSKLKFTPQLMVLAYGFMAAVCAIETFVYLQNPNRYTNKNNTPVTER